MLSGRTSVLAAMVVLGILVLTPAAQAVAAKDVPSPRPNGWAVDLTGKLPAETLKALNRLGDDVKRQTGAVLVVVVVGTVDGAVPRTFATQLFNHWAIGRKRCQESDGVRHVIARLAGRSDTAAGQAFSGRVVVG